ncbi:hypothetical protein fugu_000550 [Takifugu bimaculatus]|uniref:Disintegrin domain-containing protein n=1 Tax=Takifugu bimaculatus TaxID=433685 RepID=A0A4Z2CH86_9TELE|nr:hypothetical protein fugu_000550 [Takifugu bimaculatus]
MRALRFGEPRLRSLLPLPATVPQRLVSRRFSCHLTALHRRNHQDYVSIMLAARCLLFAAVCTGLTRWVSGDGRVLVQPKRLLQQMHGEEELHHNRLDTRIHNQAAGPQNIHLAQTSFLVEAFETSFILDLELNHNLLSTEYVERHYEEDGRLSENTGGEHCYYHGHVRGVPQSWAALSTCLGLQGMFSDGNFSYGIEPIDSDEEKNQHVVYRVPDMDLFSVDCPECPLNNTESERHSGVHSEGDTDPMEEEEEEEEKLVSREGVRRSKRQVRRGQRTVQSETKYIELMVVNDHELFVQRRRSTTHTKTFAKSVVNMADAIYKEQLNTRIVLVAMETWSSENKISVGDDVLLTLRHFMKYRKESIKEHCDAVHLFSYHLPRKFSRCSVDEYLRFLQQGGGSCLFNKPSKLLDPPECGNGYVELGEECDCGLITECARSGANCCKKCTLTHNAMCSNGLCCRDCKYELRGVTCRESVNECDIPETCTGDSSQVKKA